MPSVSQAQHGFMEMSRSAAGRRKLKAHGKTPAPKDVADEYHHADTGKKVGKLAKHVKKTSAY
jgi:hypothetical protein